MADLGHGIGLCFAARECSIKRDAEIAFAEDILTRIKIVPLREHLEAALTARLPLEA